MLSFCPAYYKKPYGQGLRIEQKAPVGRDTMGTLIFWGVIGLGVFLGIALFCLLSMAKKTDQTYACVPRVEDIAPPAHPLYRQALETRTPTISREARAQGDLSASVAAP